MGDDIGRNETQVTREHDHLDTMRGKNRGEPGSSSGAIEVERGDSGVSSPLQGARIRVVAGHEYDASHGCCAQGRLMVEDRLEVRSTPGGEHGHARHAEK
jgi:hypothetical protein